MDPFAQLLTDSSGHQVAPETLEMLGRQASQMFQSQGVPLNDAVKQLVAQHPELANEHVKRIVEFANTVTFQQMFQGSEDKNVHFDIADPGVVLRDIKDGGSPAHDGKPMSADYQKAPSQSFGSEAESALSQSFAPNTDDGQMKLAFAHDINEMMHEHHANPIDDVYDAHVRLRATREKLASSYETMSGMLRDTREDFYHQVKNEVVDPDGAGLGGVIAVLEKVAEQDIVEELMADAVMRLKEEGFQKDMLNRSLTKTAGVVVNMEHPLIAAVDGLLKVAGEMVRCSTALGQVEKDLEKTAAFLKKAGALTNKIRDAVDHKGHLPAGIRQRFPRG